MGLLPAATLRSKRENTDPTRTNVEMLNLAGLLLILGHRMRYGTTSIRKTSQELRMLSSVTLNCQVTKIVKKSGSQLSEM